MTRTEARQVEHGVKEWARQQMEGLDKLGDYVTVCDRLGLRPEDPAVGQAYREAAMTATHFLSFKEE